MRDLYATKDTYVSTALTRNVNLAWLSEQTGVADATLRRHYGRFIHADAADPFEPSKIDSDRPESVQLAPPCPSEAQSAEKDPLIYGRNLVEQKGFEPSRKSKKSLAFSPRNVSWSGFFSAVCPCGANYTHAGAVQNQGAE